MNQMLLRSSLWSFPLLKRSIATSPTVLAGITPLPPSEDFWEKNNRLQRPMSPHLTIYKFQITSMLSITHRGTGLAMSGLLSTFAIGTLFLPSSFPVYYTALSATKLGTAMIFSAKAILGFPFFFHLFNGVRHLIWDTGNALSIQQVYQTGYAMLATSTIVTLIVAAM